MEHEGLLRSANRWLLLATASLVLGAGVLSWTRAWSQAASGTLACTGTLLQSAGMDWGKQTIEFSLPYAPATVAPLEVSRQTGRFSLRAEMTRESSGLLLGTAVWEGTCAPGKEKDRRF